MTQFAWVDLEKLGMRLGFDPDSPPRPICSAQQFRELVRTPGSSLVEQNTHAFGIPQGSPLSAIFANVYMIHFDLDCKNYCESRRIYYRRYSDDIIFICNPSDEAPTLDFVRSAVAKLGRSMTISEEKTEISHFKRLATGALICDQPVTYLGFTFDGQRKRLRARTLSRYYRRMTYATRGAIGAARSAKSPKIFLRGLYRDLTHLGQHNFYSYAKRSSGILNDLAPVRQLRRHFKILHRKLGNRGR